MKPEIRCCNCGACEWIEEDGYRICTYCGSRFPLDEEELTYEEPEPEYVDIPEEPAPVYRQSSRRPVSVWTIIKVIAAIGMGVGFLMIFAGLAGMPEYWPFDWLVK